MPENTDLQARFDALAEDVGRLAVSDAERPAVLTRRNRNRRYAVVAAAIAVAVVAVGELLRWLPEDSMSVTYLDLEALGAGPGLDLDDPVQGDLAAYVGASPTLMLDRDPFAAAVYSDLVTHVGSTSLEFFVLDVAVDDLAEQVGDAGWERSRSGVWTPGDAVARAARSAAPAVRVDGTDEGRTLMTIARRAQDLPEVLAGGPAPEVSAASRGLRELSPGIAGYGVSLREPCVLSAVSLSSPTRAEGAFEPPRGTPARDVTAEQISRLDGIEAAGEVSVAGGLARVTMELENPSAPVELLQRLGLPGSTFCS